MPPHPTVHRFPVKGEGAFVNDYLVETASGVVAVDALLQVSAAREMRAGLDGLGKPLAAALLTHSHPDHYRLCGRSDGNALEEGPAVTSVPEGVGCARCDVQPCANSAPTPCSASSTSLLPDSGRMGF
jgi:hypothetical protein